MEQEHHHEQEESTESEASIEERQKYFQERFQGLDQVKSELPSLVEQAAHAFLNNGRINWEAAQANLENIKPNVLEYVEAIHPEVLTQNRDEISTEIDRIVAEKVVEIESARRETEPHEQAEESTTVTEAKETPETEAMTKDDWLEYLRRCETEFVDIKEVEKKCNEIISGGDVDDVYIQNGFIIIKRRIRFNDTYYAVNPYSGDVARRQSYGSLPEELFPEDELFEKLQSRRFGQPSLGGHLSPLGNKLDSPDGLHYEWARFDCDELDRPTKRGLYRLRYHDGKNSYSQRSSFDVSDEEDIEIADRYIRGNACLFAVKNRYNKHIQSLSLKRSSVELHPSDYTDILNRPALAHLAEEFISSPSNSEGRNSIISLLKKMLKSSFLNLGSIVTSEESQDRTELGLFVQALEEFHAERKDLLHSAKAGETENTDELLRPAEPEESED